MKRSGENINPEAKRATLLREIQKCDTELYQEIATSHWSQHAAMNQSLPNFFCLFPTEQQHVFIATKHEVDEFLSTCQDQDEFDLFELILGPKTILTGRYLNWGGRIEFTIYMTPEWTLFSDTEDFYLELCTLYDIAPSSDEYAQRHFIRVFMMTLLSTLMEWQRRMESLHCDTYLCIAGLEVEFTKVLWQLMEM